MDEDFNEKLNMDELYKQKQQSEEHKIKIYQRVLARVHKQIKATSRMRNSDKFTFFYYLNLFLEFLDIIWLNAHLI